MTELIERFIGWFNSLDEYAQIDEVVVDSATSIFEWLQGLSTNQQIVLLSVVTCLTILVYLLVNLLRRIFLRIRRWYKHKRIPKVVYHHLDTAHDELKYGENLRQNMERMKKHAPFKNRE